MQIVEGKYIYLEKVFYMLMLFLWCSYTAPFLKPFDTNYIISSIIYICIYGYYFIKYCLFKKNSPLFIILIVFACWYIAQCIKKGEITTIDYRLLYSLLLCHISFYLYKGKEFFQYFEKVLIFLSILSLAVWSSALIMPNVIYGLFNSISVWNNGSTTYGNLIVVALGNQYSMGILRNIGFTWEAGRFACFIVVGMFFNLVSCNMNIKGNKTFYIYFVTLLSTFSTTGVIAAVCVGLLYMTKKGKNIWNWAVYVFIGILILILLFQLDFIGGKIIRSIDYKTEVQNMEYMLNNNGAVAITPQRFTGLYLDYQNWVHDFWIGYNLNSDSYTQKVIFNGSNVWLSDGIIQILSKYGTIIGILLYFCLFKSSKKIMEKYSYKGGAYLYVVLFCMISISYDFWSSGLFLYFNLYWLYDIYTKSSTKHFNVQLCAVNNRRCYI